jgi:chemotaxis protein histidine kinase CheA
MTTKLQKDEFLGEVLGLFALEAREWIEQGRASLRELEGQPPPEQKAKLCETMARCITNLGGSAATVELPGLEKLAFAFLPLLQAIREQAGPTLTQIATLREGLDAITQTVCALSEHSAGEAVDHERILRRMADAATLVPEAEPAPTEPPAATPTLRLVAEEVPTVPTMSVTKHLYNILRSQEEFIDRKPTIERLRCKVKAEQDTQGKEDLDTPTIIRLFQELDDLDEQWLAEFQQKLPSLQSMLSQLRSEWWPESPSPGVIEMALQELHVLEETSRLVDPKVIAPFFHGFRTFLDVVRANDLRIAPERVDVVAARLGTMFLMAREKVDKMKTQRTSILKMVLDGVP